jgi:hypothetical protein
MTRSRRACAAIAAAVVLGATPAAADRAAPRARGRDATRTATAIADLNAQRSANGIPAGLVEDPTLTADCALHDAYMAANHELTHVEVPGQPGYTAAGAYAGESSVLTQGPGWTHGDPYDDAPLHLDQLLAPALARLGSADADGYSCTTTFPGWTRPAPTTPTTYTYPGPGVAVATSERASELPFTPGQLVGIPAGTLTGPYLIILAAAPGASPLDDPAMLTDVSLVGPDGSVALKTVDGMTSVPDGAPDRLAAYMAPGGFIIPLHALRPASRYKAHAIVTYAGASSSDTWHFTTVSLDPHSRLSLAGRRLRFGSRSRATITVVFTAIGRRAQASRVRIAPGHSAALRLSPGSWRACGTQPARGAYGPYRGCLHLSVTAAGAVTSTG